MAIRKAMVAGNWKMNGSLELVTQLSDAINSVKSNEIDIVLFPPFPFIFLFVCFFLKCGKTDKKNIFTKHRFHDQVPQFWCFKRP